MILKGTVLSIDEDRCKISPQDNINAVSPMIVIPAYIEDISKGDTVAYVVFSDNSGIILGKM